MLNVSEQFYSIQGEGQYQGYPAVFFRMQNCNLFCGQPKDAEYKQKAEGTKWVCDTIAVWMKGKAKSYEEIYNSWNDEGITSKLKEGAHLVLTGGEPLLQQNQLVEYINFFKHKEGYKPFIEVETNGSMLPNGDFNELVDRFNVSAKLSNSGNPKPLRYKPEVLEYHTNNLKSIFKFVTVDSEDTNEIFEDFIKPFNIPKEKVWLMPGAYDREELWRNGQSVAELCKQYGFKMSSRMHVEIWNRLTGV